jgi:hypothetical protein
MPHVIPLRYGTAFKKAFRDPQVFSAFVRDILGIEFETSEVAQEYSFHPSVGHVNIRYDLFAEDASRRVIVELQHIRDDETFDRFFYYHLIGLVEQVQTSNDYRLRRTVYTVVVLTRLPSKEELQFDVAVQSSDLQTMEGKALGRFAHRLVFVNVRGLRPETPPGVRKWLELFEDSLDEEVEEEKYADPMLRKVIEEIKTERISPEERFQLKEEAVWEGTKRALEEQRRAAEEQARQERAARQAAEDEKRQAEERERLAEERERLAEERERLAQERALAEAREAVLDLCDFLAIDLTPQRRAHLDSLDLDGLRSLRSSLKSRKAWP